MQPNGSIINRKLSSLFPAKTIRDKAKLILGSYGSESHEKEVSRVRLAILKLSGDDLGQLEHNTLRAKQDYRDVLAWAEYPRQSKHWKIQDADTKDRLRKADRDEYEEWLHL